MATHFIKKVEPDELDNESGYKVAKTALFFAAASLVVAAVVVPWSDSNTDKIASVIGGNIDMTVTGSVKKSEKRRTHIRRSILQANPKEPCFVLANGKTEGNC